MLDRKTLLGLAVAGLFVAVPPARSFAAAPAGAAVMADGDANKGEMKGKDEGDEKGAKKEKKTIEQDVPMAMVPPAVVDAVMKECPGGKITESALVAKKGKITYAFDVKVAGTTYVVNISVDGKFVSKKVDDDGDNEKEPAAAGEQK